MLIAIIVIVVLVALVGFVIVGFNKLRTSDIGAQEALGGIDVQLTRRAELIPNLVETVKGYAAHEAGVFEEVTKARAGVIAAAAGDDVPAKAAADAALQQALVRVNAVAEAYPDLKANQNFLAAPEPAGRDREPDRVRPPVLQRRRGLAEQAGHDDPVDAVHRHRERAQARVLRRPRGPAGRAPGLVRDGRPGRSRRSGRADAPAAPTPAAPAPAAPAAPAPAAPAAPPATPPATPPAPPADPPAGGTPPPTA